MKITTDSGQINMDQEFQVTDRTPSALLVSLLQFLIIAVAKSFKKGLKMKQ